MNNELRPNEVNLFGQRFHASVGTFYIGLGLFMGGAIHRWFAGADWLPLIGLLMLFAGAISWGALWWRQPKAA